MIKSMFDKFYPSLIHKPTLMFNLNGDISAEWVIGSWDLSMRIVNNKEGVLQATDTKSSESVVADFDFDEEDCWVEFSDIIKEILDRQDL